MNEQITVIQDALNSLIISIGDLASNLQEAKSWADESPENARLSLEAAALAADDAVNHLRTIALKCEETLPAKGEAK